MILIKKLLQFLPSATHLLLGMFLMSNFFSAAVGACLLVIGVLLLVNLFQFLSKGLIKFTLTLVILEVVFFCVISPVLFVTSIMAFDSPIMSGREYFFTMCYVVGVPLLVATSQVLATSQLLRGIYGSDFHLLQSLSRKFKDTFAEK